MTDPITTLHYTANGNFTNGVYSPASAGFNLADVSSVDQLNSLPSGVKGLVYLGDTSGATASFQSQVSAYIGNPNLYGFYLADEPNPNTVSASNLKAESDWIHSHVPGAKTFIILENMGSPTAPNFTNNFNTVNTGIDLFGVDPYPVRPEFGGANYSVIPDAVNAVVASGISLSQIVPVYQTFGGGGYSSWTLPTAAQEKQLLSTWGTVVPHPAFDYAYSWGVQNGDQALSTSTALQNVFKIHNALTSSSNPPSGSPPPTTSSPALTISTPSLTIHPGTPVGLGIQVSVPNADDVTVKITGIPKYETITDKLDGRTFPGGRSANLTADEVNSGLTISSHYKGTRSPVATLHVTATDQTTGVSTTPQTITVTDPIASAGTGAAHSVALLNQYMASSLDESQHAGFGGHKTVGAAVGSWSAEPHLTKPHG